MDYTWLSTKNEVGPVGPTVDVHALRDVKNEAAGTRDYRIRVESSAVYQKTCG